MKKKPVLINVVSGKGGTGKSLLVAILGRILAQEGSSILLVDLDPFVRGLTHFFYLYKKERRRITDKQTIADFFGITRGESKSMEFARERFFEVDLIPAVSKIEEHLEYMDTTGSSKERTKELFTSLRDMKYDFVIIDNRAGIDDMIIRCCELSDLSLSVSEADPVARSTNDNLLRHLRDSNTAKVYTIMNKVRYVKTLRDYRESMEEIRADYDIVGKIPFDVDLFESFGKPEFWNEANSTRYAYGISEAWNKLAHREEIPTVIDLKRFPESRIWPVKSSTFASRIDRMLIATGALFITAYFIVDRIMIRGGIHWLDLLLIYAVGLLFVPFIRSFVMGSDKEFSERKNRR